LEITLDKEFQALIPPSTPDELELLEESILSEGCRDPLIVWEEQSILLDGHQRKEICERHKLPFETKGLSFPDRGAARQWMIQNQLGRRNLPPFVRAELALQLKEYYDAKAAMNKALNGKGLTIPNGHKVETPKFLADVAGIGETNMSKVIRLVKEAPPETLQRLRIGEVSINSAYSKLQPTTTHKPREPKEQEAPRPQTLMPHAKRVFNPYLVPEPSLMELVQRVLVKVDDNNWLNPEQDTLEADVQTFLRSWKSGKMDSGLVLVPNQTDALWFQALAKECLLFCLPPEKPHAMFYFGRCGGEFQEVFKRHGLIIRVQS